MGKKNRIDPIDEALRILYLEQPEQDEQDILFHDPMHQLHKLPIGAKLSKKKKELLFNKLLQRVEMVPTLGLVLKEHIQKTKCDLAELSNEIKFPLERLNSLVEDLLLPNSVPVRLMKKLLVRLNIPFELVEKAILNTFRVLLENHSEARSEKLLPVSYRKTSTSISSELRSTSDAGQRALFENEEALRRYLGRLGELFKEEDDVEN